MTDKKLPAVHADIMNLVCDVEDCTTRNWVLAFKEGHKTARHAAAELASATVADYEEAMESHKVLVRELDVALNGEAGAAKQASLCDIVAQVKREGINSIRDASQSITMNGRQLRDALAAAWPDQSNPHDDGEGELTFFVRKRDDVSVDGDPMPRGLWFYWSEYPEEGVSQLDVDAPKPAGPEFKKMVERSMSSDGGAFHKVLAMPAEPIPLQDDAVVQDLAMLVRRLARSLSMAGLNTGLPQQAVDYLQRKGLQGSPLRTEAAAPPQDEWSTPEFRFLIDALGDVEMLARDGCKREVAELVAYIERCFSARLATLPGEESIDSDLPPLPKVAARFYRTEATQESPFSKDEFSIEKEHLPKWAGVRPFHKPDLEFLTVAQAQAYAREAVSARLARTAAPSEIDRKITALVAQVRAAKTPDRRDWLLEKLIGVLEGRPLGDSNFVTPAPLEAHPISPDYDHNEGDGLAGRVQAAQPIPTDLSKRLRDIAWSDAAHSSSIYEAAADEIDRYYGGMVAWKAAAEEKDCYIAELRAAYE